jgi:hypothetical protein
MRGCGRLNALLRRERDQRHGPGSRLSTSRRSFGSESCRTSLLPSADGKAKVRSKRGTMEVEADFGNLQSPRLKPMLTRPG